VSTCNDILKPGHMRGEAQVVKLEYVQVLDKVVDWKEAIRVAAAPLLENNIITENYIEKMIETVVTMGAYIVISKDIAIPHARPEDGASRTAISLLKLRNRVNFAEDKDINVIMALASSNSDDHIRILKDIATLLSNTDNYKKLMDTYDVGELYELFNN
jgi:mannitol/fructose-specific phosphotransferase system IIA component (Ntr-type)